MWIWAYWCSWYHSFLLGFEIVKIIVSGKVYLEEAEVPSALEPYYPNGGFKNQGH